MLFLFAFLLSPFFTLSQSVIGNWTFNNTLAGTGGSYNTVSAASLSPSIPSDDYNSGTVYFGEGGWPTGAINTSMYLQFTLTPNAGYALNLTSVDLNFRRSTTGSPAGSGPRAWSIRSSMDGYAADITSGVLTQSTTPTVTVTLNSSFLSVITPVTFRIYGYDVFNNTGGLNRFVFDNISARGLSLLPLNLSALSGSINDDNKSVLLKWQVSESNNVKSYEVERSTDGTAYTSVTTVYNNNTSSSGDYSYQDKTLPAGISRLFYRLRVLQFNGSTIYSDVLILQVKQNALFTINAITSHSGQVVTQITSDIAGSAKLLLTTSDGRIVYQQNLTLSKGTQVININSNNRMPGISVLTLSQNNKLISKQFMN